MKKFSEYLNTHSPFIMGGASLSGKGGGYSFGSPEEGLVQDVWDRGVRIYDSAPIYGFGQSEKVLGEALKGKDAYIISKSGIDWHENGRVNMTNSPQIVHKMLEQSLRRLNRDYIVLYMVHWPDEKVDIRHTMEAMARACDEQKILEVGLCNTNVDELKKAMEIMPISAIQCQHNCFAGLDDELIDFITDNNIPFMGWGVFDKGILTGRVDKKRESSKDYAENDARKKSPWWVQSEVFSKVEKATELKKVADELEISLLELALSFVQSHYWHNFTLIGSKTVSDWDAVLEAKLHNFDDEKLQEIKKLCLM